MFIEDIIEIIDQQIEKVCIINNDKINTNDDLKKARGAFSKWNSETSKLLRDNINETTANNFALGIGVISYGLPSIEDEIINFKKTVNDKISELNYIKNHLRNQI